MNSDSGVHEIVYQGRFIGDYADYARRTPKGIPAEAYNKGIDVINA